jgi:hypothetical protein
VEFVVDKVALGQVFFQVLRVFSANFIPPVLHCAEKRKKKRLIIFSTGLHNKLKACAASIASAAGPFTTKREDASKIQILRTSHSSQFK